MTKGKRTLNINIIKQIEKDIDDLLYNELGKYYGYVEYLEYENEWEVYINNNSWYWKVLEKNTAENLFERILKKVGKLKDYEEVRKENIKIAKEMIKELNPPSHLRLYGYVHGVVVHNYIFFNDEFKTKYNYKIVRENVHSVVLDKISKK